jgi:hypothetical protein
VGGELSENSPASCLGSGLRPSDRTGTINRHWLNKETDGSARSPHLKLTTHTEIPEQTAGFGYLHMLRKF